MSPAPTPSARTAVVYVHEEDKGLGQLGPALRRAGFTLQERLREVRAEDAAADLVVVLGGSMSAWETQAHPFLEAERQVLARRLEEGRPSLGICLGAQLLAQAAGARVYPGERGVVLGMLPVSLTPAGLADPLFAGFEEHFEVLHWHGDAFEATPGMQVLASSARYPHEAFRLGSSYGVQFHPEVDASAFAAWVKRHPDFLERSGRQEAEVLARDVAWLERERQASMLLLERLAGFFAREVGAGEAERYLFTVQAVQKLGAGVVLSPGIPRRTPIVRVGEPISLKRPDGSRVEGTVRGMASFGETGTAIPLLVQLEAPDADVPPGSEALTRAPLSV